MDREKPRRTSEEKDPFLREPFSPLRLKIKPRIPAGPARMPAVIDPRKGVEGFSHAAGGAGAKRSPGKPGFWRKAPKMRPNSKNHQG
jgi:hypothetical protein